MAGSLVDNRAYFALYPGGTSSLKQTPVPLAAYSSRTVYTCIIFKLHTIFENKREKKVEKIFESLVNKKKIA